MSGSVRGYVRNFVRCGMRCNMRVVRRARGFTLIEMVVVVALVGILASAAHPLLALAQRRSQEVALRQSLRQLREAIDAYKRAATEGRIAVAADASGYPPSLASLVDGVPDVQNPGKRLYFLRRLPRDPLAPPEQTAAQSWGLRSADSPFDAPRPGRDVFDVYVNREGQGLDGTPYRQW